MTKGKVFLIFLLTSFLFVLLLSGVHEVYSDDRNETEAEPPRPARTTSDEEDDPFADIIERPEETRREPGLPGMNIDELRILGIAKVRGEYIAYVQDIYNKPYVLRVDQRLRDGYVQRVRDNEIVYMQEVDDPVVQDKYTPIIKRLREEVR